jgi:catechol 2,3-dioxygenase-like lactoylglutathione lyase family enzyme
MIVRYKHTNIIARDWRSLARFYEEALGCVRIPPGRDAAGDWVARGTGVDGAHLKGAHLMLPGVGRDGPTLEIYQYAENLPRPATAANREGIMHIAFEVDDLEAATEKVLECGGGMLGEISRAEVDGAPPFAFVYVTDPEGNIIELQARG